MKKNCGICLWEQNDTHFKESKITVNGIANSARTCLKWSIMADTISEKVSK